MAIALRHPVSYRDLHVSPAARDLAATVNVERTAELVTADVLAAVWPQIDDAGFKAVVHRSVLANLHAIFDTIAGRLALEVSEPHGPLELAEVAAQLGMPVSEVERGHRIGVASLWTRWLDSARARVGESGEPLDELLSGPTLTMFGYTDQVLSAVIARHDAIRDQLRNTRRDLRRTVLEQILDGTTDEVTDELEQVLDYCLTDTHLALLLEAPAGRPTDHDIAALRAAAAARGTLVLQHGPQSWIVWLGLRDGFGPTQRSRLGRALAGTGLTVAVGEPGAGLAGLRRTREQALEAAWVQRALGAEGQPCLWAREVCIEALLLKDELLGASLSPGRTELQIALRLANLVGAPSFPASSPPV